VAQDKLDKGKVKLKNPCEKKRKEKKGKKRKVVEIGEKKDYEVRVRLLFQLMSLEAIVSRGEVEINFL
jgi:hypothetical protein